MTPPVTAGEPGPQSAGEPGPAPVPGPAELGLAVCVEQADRRSFASALDWPGWCRAGRTPDAAIAALLDYAPRYAPVAARAGHPLPDPLPAARVVERAPGTATTRFGAPDVVAEDERRPLAAAEAGRRADLLVAAWRTLDVVAAAAPPVLRKGPRGGGRDRDAVVAHVVGAEASYARLIGIRRPAPQPDDPVAVAALRAAIGAALRAATGGEPLRERGWPARYAARRMAWHVLDHAWEIEDRTEG